MNKWKLGALALMIIMVMPAFAAQKREKAKADEPTRVYLYGVSVNFNDSVVYMTDLLHLDSMVVNKDASITGYSSYSLQMKVYLEGTLGEVDRTCAVLYSADKKKLERKYLKMRKKYQADKSTLLKLIGADAFQFRKD